jgi:hypothetical protein
MKRTKRKNGGKKVIKKITTLLCAAVLAILLTTTIQDFHRYEQWKQEQRNAVVGPYKDFYPYLNTFAGRLRLIFISAITLTILIVLIYPRRTKECPREVKYKIEPIQQPEQTEAGKIRKPSKFKFVSKVTNGVFIFGPFFLILKIALRIYLSLSAFTAFLLSASISSLLFLVFLSSLIRAYQRNKIEHQATQED